MPSGKTIGNANLPHVRAALNEALRIARAPSQECGYALSEIAARFASIDPERAVEIALSITGISRRDETLSDLVEVIAQSDPQLAISVARGITRQQPRIQAFAALLGALDSGSPFVGRAADEAMEIALSIKRKSAEDWPLLRIARPLARLDADRTLQLARSISRLKWRTSVISRVVREVGKTDFGRALEIERGIKYRNVEHAARRLDAVRSSVAYALADTAPDKALRLARSITDPAMRARAVFRVTLADARRSEKRLRRAWGKLFAFARTAGTPEHRASSLARLAAAWTELKTAPPKALREELRRIVRDLDYRDWTRDEIAEAVVEWDPDAALGIVEGLERGQYISTVEERALSKLAVTDPQRALARVRNVKCRCCRADTLRLVASTLAAADADGALATIQAVKSKPTRMSLMRGWAEEVTKTDPDRAIAVARKEDHEDVRVEMMRGIAGTLAASDLRRALKVARMIADKRVRCDALLDIAEHALPQKRHQWLR